MSRQIDVSDLSKLSEDDIAYLRARGQVYIVQELDKLAKKPAAPKPEEVEEEVEPYEEWTNEELREELKNRHLSTDGKKDDLVARLYENDAQS